MRDALLWQRLGLPYPDLGPNLLPYFTRWLPEPNLARVHRQTLEGSDRLAVYLHTNAVQLVFGEDGKRVTGVRCRTFNEPQKEVIFTAECFVLCLGGIESSRFLLQPQNPAPWSGNRLLGRHFMDHIDADTATIQPLNRPSFHALFDNVYLDGRKFHPKFKPNEGLLEREKLLRVAAMVTFSSEADETISRLKTTGLDLLRGRRHQVKLTDLGYAAVHLPTLMRQTWRCKVNKRAYVPSNARVHLRVHCEQEPLGESRISLSEKRDELGLFRATLDWRVSNLELDTISRYTEIVRKAFGDLNLAIVEPDRDLLEDAASFCPRCDDSNHHMGGVRMSTSAIDGLVDPMLRLHGTKNAYVCSSAVFPTSGFSNPTHTLLAFAIRLADTLAAKVSPLQANASSYMMA
jgi:choline dehydrogenase-like flavoprotein